MSMSTVSLRDIVEAKTGTRNPTALPDESFTYVDVASVDNNVKAIFSARSLLGLEAPSRARKVIRQGDILVSTIRPNLNAVALVPADLDGQIASTGFCVLRPTDHVLSEYLFYFVQSQSFVSSLCTLVAGAMYPAVSDSQVLDQRIPFPELVEQRRIVDLLSRAEGIVRLRRDAQKKAAELIPAIFLNMFGDPATNPKGWPVVPLGESLRSVDYGSSTKASDYGNGIPLIRMGNVGYDGSLDLSNLKYVQLENAEVEKYRLSQGDILFNRTNSKELVGKTGLWGSGLDAVVASYFIRLRVKQDLLSPVYLWAFMNTRHMKRVLFDTARGAIGQANINSKELKAFRIGLPPLPLQEAFKRYVDSVESITAQQAEASGKAIASFDALLASAFVEG